jgi:hypothetical protein
MKKLLYTVKHGGRIIVGPDPNGLYSRVKRRLGTVRVFGHTLPYEYDTFLYNVRSVGEDIQAGRIANPADVRGWEDTIVAEFQANLKALERGEQ